MDCELIDVIECIVYDGSNNELASETFDCSAHQGTIDNIPVGSNRKVIILGIDVSGNIIYYGEVLGVTIAAGQTNNLGTIDAYYFIPTNLSAVATSPNQINLAWNISSENIVVAGYNIYRNGTFLKSVSSTSTTDMELTPLTQYCYSVSAFDTAGNESGQSSQVCETTPETVDGENPTTPTDLSATAVSLSQINLSWNASTDNVGVAGYNVYRNGIFLKSVSSTSTTDTGLDPLTQYCYRVSAYDAAENESGRSSQNCVTTLEGEKPTTPTDLLTIAVSSSQIELSWNASSDNIGVAGYNVYRDGTFLKSVSSTSTNDTGLNPLTQYCYRVSAFDAAGNESEQSSQACETTLTPPDATAPSPDPMTWAIEPYAASSSEISMWATNASDPSTPITYMFDFVDSPTGGSGGYDSMWTTSTLHSNYGLDPNQQYGYRVRARDGEDNTTDYSSTLYTYTLANTPGYLSESTFSNVTENSIRVSWAANGNPAGTEYYCVNQDNGTNSGWTTALYWDSTGLLCDSSHGFSVRARNGDGVTTGWTALGNQDTPECSDVHIMIGDNDGYGYGINDYADLPYYIFDNRDETESSATDGSQHTDYEPNETRQFSFTIEFPPLNPSAYPSAALIVDVSGIMSQSSLYIDDVDYSSWLPGEQGTLGSDIRYVYIDYPYTILEDGQITVNFQGGESDTIAFDYFEFFIEYYAQ